VKKGKEAAFKKILSKHGPTLIKAGLSPKGGPRVWKSECRGGKTVFLEHMQWKDVTSAHTAHQMPEVMAVWEPMGKLCTGMEFLHMTHAGI
jgi:hypothetical protein